MKIIAIPACLDLAHVYGITPAWWQILKGLYEEGIEVVAIPYRGRALETLWWRTYPNPCKIEGDMFASWQNFSRRFSRYAPQKTVEKTENNWTKKDQLILKLIHTFILPRWKKHLLRIIEREKGVKAIIAFGLPINHLAGLATAIKQKFSIPFFSYDGDVPASLPKFSGFQTGFRIYPQANLQEIDAIICNSLGGVPQLRELGAKEVHYLPWGIDPDVFSPVKTNQDIDFFFYGVTDDYRQQWLKIMIAEASEIFPQAVFAIRVRNMNIDFKRARHLPYLSFCELRNYICRTKINLSINRDTHRLVHASSTCRIFELAAMQACTVSNSYLGVAEWFEPQKEIVIVESKEEVQERYKWLLDNPKVRRQIGESARVRVLKQHTHRHRARKLIQMLGLR